jgi:hypothetical protein
MGTPRIWQRHAIDAQIVWMLDLGLVEKLAKAGPFGRIEDFGQPMNHLLGFIEDAAIVVLAEAHHPEELQHGARSIALSQRGAALHAGIGSGHQLEVTIEGFTRHDGTTAPIDGHHEPSVARTFGLLGPDPGEHVVHLGGGAIRRIDTNFEQTSDLDRATIHDAIMDGAEAKLHEKRRPEPRAGMATIEGTSADPFWLLPRAVARSAPALASRVRPIV